MSVKFRNGTVVFLAVSLLATGCSNKPKLYDVTGEVTWLGKNLAKGQIVFEDSDPQIAPVAGEIADGKFEVKLAAGKKKVKILANREKPGAKVDPAMGAVPQEQYIPVRYNHATMLEAEVTEDGENHFKFLLTP